MKLKEPNPLNVFGVRRLEFMPEHFESVNFPFNYNLETSIIRWIEQNQKSRFYVGKNIDIDSKENRIKTVLTIGFEDPKELSYFMLACPHLKYY